MLRWTWLAVVFALACGLTPAEAKRKPEGVCPYPNRTGVPLPRQAQATLSARLATQPYPTNDAQRLESLQPGETVTVVEECVLWVRVETASGAVGWAHVGAMQSEQRLLETAAIAFNVARGVPDPCQRYVPTGAPLPRQSFTSRAAPLYMFPNRFDDGPFEELPQNIQVTVLRECGTTLRIRTADGVEGWVDLVMVDNENRLRQAALQQPIASADECDLRYDDAQVAQRCRTEFATSEAHRAEMEASTYLTGAEIAAFVAGKTFKLIRADDYRASSLDPSWNYFATDGQYYLKTGVGGAGTSYRGRWRIASSHLCMPKAYQPCYRLLRTVTGDIKWMATVQNTLTEYVGIEDAGSTARIVAEISPYYPDVPDELPLEETDKSGMSGPAMGD